ncbi:alpha/beta hydrolase [Sphingomonas sp. ASV193]|uniref:alpha/beta hydrolase n=1 Tax=Sphingomonas sp. ASV193 TaxID=3144405 RepID=UPI0032E8716A
MMTMLAAAALTASTITAPGPQAPLEGTLINAGKGAPVVVIIPGSGPTDRNGNNPMGVAAQPYKLLAEALAAKGVSSVRIDKRGMFGSKGAVPDPNKVTIADYAADAHAWAKAARKATGAKCVWLAGHSEGSLVALAAGQDPADLCGIVSISGMGRPFGTVLADQLKAQAAGQPAATPLLDVALKAIASLEAGKTVDTATMPAPLMPLFAPQVQGYEIDLMKYRPAALAGSLKLPLLIVQGDQDTQVTVADAKLLADAQPKAKLVIAPGVNHVLKTVKADDPAANRASYADPSLPVAPAVVNAIAAFVRKR